MYISDMSCPRKIPAFLRVRYLFFHLYKTSLGYQLKSLCASEVFLTKFTQKKLPFLCTGGFQDSDYILNIFVHSHPSPRYLAAQF